MKIGIVVPYFTSYISGNEYGLAQSLSSFGHDVTIITSTAGAPREKELNANNKCSSSAHDFSITYLPTKLDVGDNPVVLNVEKHVKCYDVLMLQEDYPFLCHKSYSTAKKYDISTILSSERTYFPDNILKRSALRILDATVNKRLRDGVDILTAHCTSAKEFMINELGVRRETQVINVGVDAEMFKPFPCENKYLHEGDFKILTVARLHKYKGLKNLIEAMSIIVTEIPAAHLYILGKGPEKENLQVLVGKLQLNRSVTFISQSFPNSEMPHLYSECDVYVQPSVVEPYGIAVLEALACGKPVVGSNIGGMIDTIVEGKSGFLVDPSNPAGLVEKLLMLSDQKLREKFGVFARERVENEFSWDIIGYTYLKHIKKLQA